MRSVLLSIAVLLVSVAANAEAISFQSAGLAGMALGGGRIFVDARADGKLAIQTPDGKDVVEAKVIADRRPADGNLELDLGKGRTLTVTSGFSPDMRVHYILKLDGRLIEMQPVLWVQTK